MANAQRLVRGTIKANEDGVGAIRMRKIFSWIKIWVLVPLLVIVTGVSGELLRENSLGMISRRSAVVTSDTKGDSAKTIQALGDLQRFVMGHMNTDMGNKGVYLQQ